MKIKVIVEYIVDIDTLSANEGLEGFEKALRLSGSRKELQDSMPLSEGKTAIIDSFRLKEWSDVTLTKRKPQR